MNKRIVVCLLLLVAPAVSAMEEKDKEEILEQRKTESRILLNVGGIIYNYPESILSQSGSVFFLRLLDPKFRQNTDEKGRIYVSYGREAFKEVDHFLNTKNLLGDCRTEVIKDAANYFGLEDMRKMAGEWETAAKDEPKFQQLKLESNSDGEVTCICQKKFQIYDPEFGAHLENDHGAKKDEPLRVKPLNQSCSYPATIFFRIPKQ